MKKPSVSKLLALLDKPALLGWANKIGLQGITLTDHRAESQAKGNSLHNQVMHFCKNKTPFSDPKIQAKFEKFLKDKEIIDVEQNIENEYLQGRYDNKLIYKGEKYICDFKSSDRVYFETVLQLMAYRMCDKECKIAVIQLPEFNFIPIDIRHEGEYEAILIALSLIYECKHKINF